jgi:single-strand DNA-binding protein
MSRNNVIEVTVRGRVIADPTEIRASNGNNFTGFRLAATPRVLDRETGLWSDGKTEWISVSVFGQPFAKNVLLSLHRGQPVIVHGVLSTGEWTDRVGQTHSDLRLRADVIGHDLFWGRSDFWKVAEQTATTQAAADDGPPVDGAIPTSADDGVPGVPIDASAADVPLTDVPLTDVPPTDAPPSDAPPVEASAETDPGSGWGGVAE